MKTILVTGAEGFAGTRLTSQLRDHGYMVVAGVRNRARKLAWERQHRKALVCDVSDAINVARVVASVKPDGVVHLAGFSHAGQAGAQPLEAYQSVVTGWANVLDAVRRFVPRARLLLISACDVYGRAGGDGQPLREDTPPEPATTFGELKLAAESIAQAFFRRYHLNLTVARPFHYTGPGQPEAFFFGAVARRLAAWDPDIDGTRLSLPDLDCRRDLLHVQDVVEAYERLLVEGRPGEVYNVCSGQARTCAEWIAGMIKTARVDVQLAQAPRTGDDPVPVYLGDNTKLRTELGWQPTHTADGALQELIRSCTPRVAAQPR